MAKITIDLEAGTAQFIDGMNKSAHSVDELGSHAHEAKGFLDRFKEGFEWETGAEIAREGLRKVGEGLEFLGRQYEDVARMGRDATKLGISVEDLSRFQHAANASGLEITTLTTGIDRLNQSIGKISSGEASGKQAADALAKLGLNAQELAELDPAQAFQRVSAALAGMNDKYERAAITQELLGRSGRELLPVMTNLRELMQESDDIGFTRTAENVEAAERQEREMAKATDGLKASLMDLATSPWSEKLVEGFAHAAQGLKYLIDQWNDPGSYNRFAQLEAQAISLNNAFEKTPRSHGGSLDEQIESQKQRVEAAKQLAEVEQQINRMKQADATDLRNTIIAKDNLRIEEHHLKLLEDQKHAQEELAKAQQQSAHAAELAANAEQDQWEKAQKAVDAIKERAREAGMSEQQKELSKFMQLHPDSHQIKDFTDALTDQAAAENQKKLAEEAKRVWEESLTPMDKYAQKLREIDELVKQHALTEAQGKHAAGHVLEEMAKEQERERKHSEDHKAELVQRHFDFRMPAHQQQQNADPLRKLAEQSQQQGQMFLTWNTYFQQIWNTITQNGGTSSNGQTLDF